MITKMLTQSNYEEIDNTKIIKKFKKITTSQAENYYNDTPFLFC
jgi:hypothetical protein